MFVTQIPSSPILHQPIRSKKRQNSELDCMHTSTKPQPTCTTPKNQPSIADIWCLTRSDEGGPEGIWKRPRLTKGRWQDEVVMPVCKEEGSSSLSIQSAICPPNPSSLASRNASNSSLFSIQSLWSNITDGFSELDWGFQPEIFPLELHPLRGIHSSWLEHLKPVFTQPEIIALHQQFDPKYLGYNYKLGEKPPHLQTEISPPANHLYSWSRLTPLDQVKVVILGSRPHPRATQSHGLAFSQPTTCPHVSGAIQSIHRELENQYPDKFIRPTHGSLVSWAQAGVLLLNIVQTAPRDDETAHGKFGWQEFTRQVLQIVSREGGSVYSEAGEDHSFQKGIVFIGWGEQASREIHAAGILQSTRNHMILTSPGSPHPSSAWNDGFFHRQHFRLANDFLTATYGHHHAIPWWDLLPLDP
ncbi:uncharacterized protein VP01_1536g8 [Puccinia sorghi]|uniref:Uracil-DNA glycosylase-like domain-containing protein n=1 Tax=Puccinia sorghi TaxID=27349 RepID=A0A0L6VKB4_9BASI|nr:uncharacterized protein VP01_1536g8 [Puccinia sorghi]